MVIQEDSGNAQNGLTKYLKLEAVWILTNLAYGDEEETTALLDYSENG